MNVWEGGECRRLFYLFTQLKGIRTAFSIRYKSIVASFFLIYKVFFIGKKQFEGKKEGFELIICVKKQSLSGLRTWRCYNVNASNSLPRGSWKLGVWECFVCSFTSGFKLRFFDLPTLWNGKSEDFFFPERNFSSILGKNWKGFTVQLY